MNGMEMMLKSFGFDPEQIKSGLLNAQKSIMEEVQKLHSEIESVNAKVTRIEIKLGTIPETVAMQLLEDGANEAFTSAAEYVRTYNGDSRDSNNGNGSDSRQDNGNTIGDYNG